jgi:DNA repair exonuclease SbcCD nuclease subunit
VITILHTADWHLGHTFRQFDSEDALKLARARLEVIDRILGIADQYDVAAVLCAGDLFDTPSPDAVWWQGLANAFRRRSGWVRPVILLPGNHDPLTRDSVFDERHPFRNALPDWVHIVDRDDFTHELSAEVIVLAAPCRSTAGDNDLALSLPQREPGDARIRIGLVHGSTFDMEGYQTNFPIARDAAERRGLDYLAIGDTHAFREIPEGSRSPTVYPSAPEPTRFGECDAGYVALVSFRRQGDRPRIRKERVSRWTWREEAVRSMADLRKLLAEDLTSTVLRLRLQLAITLSEREELEAALASLKGTIATHGRVGVLVTDRTSLGLQLSSGEFEGDLPETVRIATARLQEMAKSSKEAENSLVILHKLLHQLRAEQT